MNQYQLMYAVDVLRYKRGDIEATKGMIDYVLNEHMPNMTTADFGLTVEQLYEAREELARLDAMERDDDPGDVGYLRRKYALERM